MMWAASPHLYVVKVVQPISSTAIIHLNTSILYATITKYILSLSICHTIKLDWPTSNLYILKSINQL